MEDTKNYANYIKRIDILKEYFLREIPELNKLLLRDRLPDIDALKTFASNSSSFYSNLRQVLKLAKNDGKSFNEFREVRRWLSRKIESTDLAAFLCIKATNDTYFELLTNHRQRVAAAIWDEPETPEYEGAVVKFVELVRSNKADVSIDDLELLDNVFGRKITHLLDRGCFYLESAKKQALLKWQKRRFLKQMMHPMNPILLSIIRKMLLRNFFRKTM